MSTKTTIKRIALVAVSALGLGVLSSVAPASAANTEGTLSVTQVTSGRLNAPVVLKVTLPFTTDASVGGDDTITVQAKLLTSAPGASALDGDNFRWQDYNSNNLFTLPSVVPTAGGADLANDGKFSVDNSTSNDRNTMVLDPTQSTALSASTAYTLTAFAAFTPDKVGTWNWVVWSDTDGSGTLNASETSANISVAVDDSAVASITVTSVGGTAPTTASVTSDATLERGLIKVSLKGADGLPAIPKTSEYLTARVTSGAATLLNINDNSSTTDYIGGTNTAVGDTGGASGVTSFNLNSYNFNQDGAVYMNIQDATAETAIVTVAVGGSTISASGSQKFVLASGTTHTDGIQGVYTTTAGVKESGSGADPSFSIGAGSKTSTYYVATTATEAVAAVDVTDTSGLITGLRGADYSIVVTGATDVMTSTQVTAVGFSTSSYLTSFKIASASGNVTGGTYQLRAEGNAAQTTTVIASTATTATLRSPIAASGTLRAATGASNSFLFRCVDDLGARKANVTVTTTITGRNAGLVTMPTVVTNASGEATISYTDASTSTSSLTDSLSFAGCGSSISATVVYSAATGLGVDTVKVTGGYYTANVANSTITANDINADVDGASATTHPMVATVKDASGNLLVGVPVVFTISGTGCAITSTTQTVYTGSAGTAQGNVYGWLAGDCTVTATSGGKTGSAMIRFAQQTATEARTLSAAVNGSIVTATVKDRFGNPVAGAPVYARISSGSGYFGSGTLTADSGNAGTAQDGTVSFIVTGGPASVDLSTVSFSANPGTTYGQTFSRAGKVDYNVDPADDTAFTATTVGTTATAETGIGASFAPAGVNKVSVDVVATGVTDSVDAANDAVEAANAATDAANAAAEAADAATAAAQDAQAAVADLAAQVATLISGIKAQITRLTNLVVKIQKKVRA